MFSFNLCTSMLVAVSTAILPDADMAFLVAEISIWSLEERKRGCYFVLVSLSLAV